MGLIDGSVLPGGEDSCKSIASAASKLGFTAIAVPLESGDYCGSKGPRVYTRGFIEARTRREVRKGAETLYPKVDIVVVKPLTLEAARYSAASKKVHVIRVDESNRWAADRGTAEIFRQRGWGAVEISLKPLLSMNPRSWQAFASIIRRLYPLGVQAFVVSDATNPFELWSPISASSLISTLGVPVEHSMLYMSEERLKSVIEASKRF